MAELGRLVLIHAALLGIVVNAAQFIPMDDRASNRYKAIHPHEPAEFVDMAGQSPRFRERYGAAVELGRHHPRSRILVVDESLYNRPQFRMGMLGFGRAKALELGRMDAPRRVLDTDLEPYRIASQLEGSNRDGEFHIFSRDGEADMFVAFRLRRAVYLIDARLVDVPADALEGRE